MADTNEKLIRMVNQIAGFMATQPGADQAGETAAHIRTFWDPRMRAQLEVLVTAGGQGLSPLALQAARKLSQSAAA